LKKIFKFAIRRGDGTAKGCWMGYALYILQKNDRCFSYFGVEVKIESEPQIDFAAWAVFDLRACIILGLGIWIVG